MKLYKICNKISLLLHVLASAAGYFVMEAICRHSFIEAWNYMTQRPLVFAYNAAFIFTSSLIVYLFHRRVFWRILVTLFWLILAIINGACTSSERVLRQLNLSWGVYPMLIKEEYSSEILCLRAIEAAQKHKLVKVGDTIVFAGGVPLGIPGRTNLIRVCTVE